MSGFYDLFGKEGPAILGQGVLLTRTPTSIDFVGAGVTTTVSGNAITVTIPGGGGSSTLLAVSAASITTANSVYQMTGVIPVHFKLSNGNTAIFIQGTSGRIGFGVNTALGAQVNIKSQGTTSADQALTVKNSNNDVILSSLSDGSFFGGSASTYYYIDATLESVVFSAGAETGFYMDNSIGTITLGDFSSAVNGTQLILDDQNSIVTFNNAANTVKVGINNASPTYPLDVTGIGRVTGNFGVGATPIDKLYVYVDAADAGITVEESTTGGNQNSPWYSIKKGSNQQYWALAGANSSFLTGALAGDMIFRAGTGSNILFGVSSAPYMTILNGGNVGIGTTTPSFKLQVDTGIASVPAVVDSSSVEQGFVTYDGTAKQLFFGSTSVGSTTYSFFRTNRGYNGTSNTTAGYYNTRPGASLQLENDAFVFYQFAGSGGTTANEVFRVASGGNVGIASSSPSYLLSLGAGKGFAEYNSGGTNNAIKVVANTAGAVFGVQNIASSGFSGIEYIDNTGAVQVFTGYNNGVAGEFRFNNIATSGFIAFKISSVDRLVVNNTGTITLSSLAGTGTRMVTADATGTLGTQSINRLAGYTVATLPAGTIGDTAYVTDALAPTFLATVVGGGAVVTPVFYNGTNWVGY